MTAGLRNYVPLKLNSSGSFAVPPGLPNTFIPGMMSPTTKHSVPSTTQCRTDADRQVFLQLFFSLTRKGSCVQIGHIRNMSLPCLVTAVRGRRRPHCKERLKTKILVTRGATEVKRETLRPLRSEASFPGNPIKPVLLHQEQEAERARSLKAFTREPGFQFSFLYCKFNLGIVKYFMPWQKLIFLCGEEEREGFLRELLKLRGFFWVL